MSKKIHQDIPVMENPSHAKTYAQLSKNRSIFLKENVTKDSAAIICALLYHYAAQDPDENINLYIHSNGGDVDGFFQIYDTMQLISAPVSTICLGKAYSAGAFLLCSGTGTRSAFKHSDIMIHGIQCTFPNAPEEKYSMDYLSFLNKKNVDIMQIVSDKTGIVLEDVILDCSRDLFLTAEEALNYGIIDEIIEH